MRTDRRPIVAGLLLLMWGFSGSTWATTYSASGTANVLNIPDLSVFGANTDWFELTGVSSMGNCKGWGQGLIFRLKDDTRGQQMYATLLTAFTAGTTATVFADDTYADAGGDCYAEQVVLGSMP